MHRRIFLRSTRRCFVSWPIGKLCFTPRLVRLGSICVLWRGLFVIILVRAHCREACLPFQPIFNIIDAKRLSFVISFVFPLGEARILEFCALFKTILKILVRVFFLLVSCRFHPNFSSWKIMCRVLSTIWR